MWLIQQGTEHPVQRYTISTLRKENYTQISIAERINKHHSVVSREL